MAVIDRAGTYRGTRAVRLDGCWEMQYLESDSSNLEIYYVTNRKPMEFSKNRRNAPTVRLDFMN